jgi:hypothetical protein
MDSECYEDRQLRGAESWCWELGAGSWELGLQAVKPEAKLQAPSTKHQAPRAILGADVRPAMLPPPPTRNLAMGDGTAALVCLESANRLWVAVAVRCCAVLDCVCAADGLDHLRPPPINLFLQRKRSRGAEEQRSREAETGRDRQRQVETGRERQREAQRRQRSDRRLPQLGMGACLPEASAISISSHSFLLPPSLDISCACLLLHTPTTAATSIGISNQQTPPRACKVSPRKRFKGMSPWLGLSLVVH